jgi:hypothetical protein
MSTKGNDVVTPEKLQINDTFWMKYGSNYLRFRVHTLGTDYVMAHGLKWCKSSCVRIGFNEMERRGFIYQNRISKLRAFFLP